jgi:hypothetical protein
LPLSSPNTCPYPQVSATSAPDAPPSEPSELKRGLDRLKLRRALRQAADATPTWYYEPSPGQLAFHASHHAVRFLCPGNGWGKTVACGHEVNAWMTHSNRWRETPTRDITACWFPEDYKQFRILLEKLREKCWGPLPVWREQAHTITWPDGGTLYVVPKDRNWKHIQGIPIDLAIFDEHFPKALYTEIQMRRRGEQPTEIVIAATMTLGMTWEYRAIYKPWLDYHASLGIGEDEAMGVQGHHAIFCWPKGGLADNPSMSAEDRRHAQEDVSYSCDKEKVVRLGGGFQDWAGDPVFDVDALERIKVTAEALEKARPTAIKAGSFVVKPPK